MIVALRKSSSWFDRLIDRLSGGGGFCHCELLTADGHRITSTAATGFTTKPRAACDRYLPYSSDNWTLVNIGREEAARFILHWADGEKGTRYDFLGVFRFVFPWIGPSGKRWWCSEVVETALHIAGICLHTARWTASPNSLAKRLAALEREERHAAMMAEAVIEREQRSSGK